MANWFKLLGMVILVSSCSHMKLKKICHGYDWTNYVKKYVSVGEDYKQGADYLACTKVKGSFKEVDLQAIYNSELPKYCKKENVKVVGEKGLYFKYELCPSISKEESGAAHLAGVRKYCKSEGAFEAGKTGRPYNKICPEDLVTDFISEFDRGRRDYLLAEIGKLQRKIETLDYQLTRTYSDRTYTSSKLNYNMYRSSYLNYVNQTAGQMNSDQYYYNDTLRHRMFSIENDIRYIQFYKRDLRLKIQKLNEELKQADGRVKNSSNK